MSIADYFFLNVAVPMRWMLSTVIDQNPNVQIPNYAKIWMQESLDFRQKFGILYQTKHIRAVQNPNMYTWLGHFRYQKKVFFIAKTV